jgi:hypothetical protein
MRRFGIQRSIEVQQKGSETPISKKLEIKHYNHERKKMAKRHGRVVIQKIEIFLGQLRCRRLGEYESREKEP